MITAIVLSYTSFAIVTFISGRYSSFEQKIPSIFNKKIPIFDQNIPSTSEHIIENNETVKRIEEQ